MSAPEASFEPGQLLRALADRGVEFVVIGGMAVIGHGMVRATADVDGGPPEGRWQGATVAAVARWAERSSSV